MKKITEASERSAFLKWVTSWSQRETIPHKRLSPHLRRTNTSLSALRRERIRWLSPGTEQHAASSAGSRKTHDRPASL